MILRIKLPLSISSVSQDPERMTEKSSANAKESVLEGNFSSKIELNAIDQKIRERTEPWGHPMWDFLEQV